MQINTAAIVLKTMNYSESSIIARLFTRELGYRSFIINGVRKKKQSRKAAIFRPMNIIQISCNDLQPDKLQRLYNADYDVTFEELPFNVTKSAVGLFCIEVLLNSLQDHSPNDELFDFAKEFYQHLDQSIKANAKQYLFFLTKLTTYLGIAPLQNFTSENSIFNIEQGQFVSAVSKNNRAYVLDEETSKALFLFIQSSFTDYLSVSISRIQSKELLEGLIKYFQFHIENFRPLKSKPVLETIFSNA